MEPRGRRWIRFAAVSALVLAGAGCRTKHVPVTPNAESAAAERTRLLQAMQAKIAGRERDRAGDVFMNVKLLQDAPAENFLRAMSYYGRSLGVGCSHCHVIDAWASDAKAPKRVGRQMIALVDTINERFLTKLGGGRPAAPTVGCSGCHRGQPQPPP